MIKALRITSLLVVLAAVGFVVFLAWKGKGGDEAIEKYLLKVGVAAQMQAGKPVKAGNAGQDSPLVRQARAFALRINPPVPKVGPRVSPAGIKPISRRPTPSVAAKFNLVGTSNHLDDESNSWALIDEVGKGLHWVKCGSKVGHLVIEKIGYGIVLIKDNGRSYELAMPQVEKPDYVKSYSGEIPEQEIVRSWSAEDIGKISSETKPGSESSEPAIIADVEAKEADIQENIEWIKKLQQDPESFGMTAAEANELGGLGDILKDLEMDIKRVESDSNQSSSVLDEDKGTSEVSAKEKVNSRSSSSTRREISAELLRRKRANRE